MKAMTRSIILVLIFFSRFAFGIGGVIGGGGGGDGISLEFNEISHSLTKVLQQWPEHSQLIKDISSIQAMVQTMTVSSEENLSLNGIPKDAINYPEQQKIIVDRNRWSDLGLEGKYALVLHELLGLTGQDDTQYTVSSQFASYLRSNDSAWVLLPAGWVDVCQRSDSMRAFLESRFEKSCDQISPRDLTQLKKMNMSATRLEANDLSGMSSLETVYILTTSNPLKLPGRFFQMSPRLKLVQINGNVDLGDEVFNTGTLISQITIGLDNSQGSGFTCSNHAFSGLNVVKLRIEGFQRPTKDNWCDLDKISATDLSLVGSVDLSLFPWEKIPAGLQKLMMYNNIDAPPNLFPTYLVPNMQSITDMTLGRFLFRAQQFQNFPHLSSLSIWDYSGISKDALEGLAATELSLHDKPSSNIDTQFLVPVKNLQSLRWDISSRPIGDFNFESQKNLMTLALYRFADFKNQLLNRKTLGFFSHLKKLHLGNWIGGHSPYDPSALAELNELEILTCFESDPFPFDLSNNLKMRALHLPIQTQTEEKTRLLKLYSDRIDVLFDSSYL